jgi:flagellar FliL protein
MAAKPGKNQPKADAAEDGGESDGAAAPVAAPKKRRLPGRTLVLFIILPVVVLLGGGAAAHLMGVTAALFGGGSHAEADTAPAPSADSGNSAKKAEAPKGGHGEAPKATAAAVSGGKGAIFYNLPEMIVNLNSTGRRSNFLKISVSLELEQSGDIAKIESVMPRIVDNFQTYLRELRVEDLRGSSGLFRLREELLSRVSVAAAPAKINDVLFKEMLVQ